MRLRTVILSIRVPFCVSDLFTFLRPFGFDDRNAILDTLDKLHEEGLVEYRKVGDAWAFCVT